MAQDLRVSGVHLAVPLNDVKGTKVGLWAKDLHARRPRPRADLLNCNRNPDLARDPRSSLERPRNFPRPTRSRAECLGRPLSSRRLRTLAHSSIR